MDMSGTCDCSCKGVLPAPERGSRPRKGVGGGRIRSSGLQASGFVNMSPLWRTRRRLISSSTGRGLLRRAQNALLLMTPPDH